MDVQSLTYFYPKKDWKGEFGYDVFAWDNNANVNVMVPRDPLSVSMKASYLLEGVASYEQENSYDPTVPNESSKYYLSHDISFNKWYVMHEGDEDYFYFSVPFINRRKTVCFDFEHPESKNKYHYCACYNDKGSLEKLTVEKDEDRFEFSGKEELLGSSHLQALEMDVDLIERLFKNVDLIDGDPTLGDCRISEAVVDGSSSTIEVTYADNHKVTYEYLAADLCGLTYENPQEEKKTFRGSAESVIIGLNEAGLKVIGALLSCPLYCQPDQIYPLDEGIKEVKIEMKKAHSLKCILQTEPARDILLIGDLEKNEVRKELFNTFKVVGGKANIPDRIENGEVVFKEVSFTAEEQRFNDLLVPVWMDQMTKNLVMRPWEDDYVMYPVPIVSMVNYEFTDKRNGLTNDRAPLQVQTLGKFNEVHFESGNLNEVKTGVDVGSTKKAMETMTLLSSGIEEGYHLVRSYDDNDMETGRVNIKVFRPVHLKVCFIMVGFQTHPDSVGWNYKADAYLKLFGQAGVVFDDIAESFMTVDETEATWDTMLKEPVYSSNTDLVDMLEGTFKGQHPEFGDYCRVYIVDKCMVDDTKPEERQFITYQLSQQQPEQGVLAVFKRSIEVCDATDFNPVAIGLLQSIGVKDVKGDQIALTREQWDEVRLAVNTLTKKQEKDSKKKKNNKKEA